MATSTLMAFGNDEGSGVVTLAGPCRGTHWNATVCMPIWVWEYARPASSVIPHPAQAIGLHAYLA